MAALLIVGLSYAKARTVVGGRSVPSVMRAKYLEPAQWEFDEIDVEIERARSGGEVTLTFRQDAELQRRSCLPLTPPETAEQTFAAVFAEINRRRGL